MDDSTEPTIQLTAAELEQFVKNLVLDADSKELRQAALMGAAKALEVFASAIETSHVKVSPDIILPIVEATLRDVAQKARGMAREIQAMRQD